MIEVLEDNREKYGHLLGRSKKASRALKEVQSFKKSTQGEHSRQREQYV